MCVSLNDEEKIDTARYRLEYWTDWIEEDQKKNIVVVEKLQTKHLTALEWYYCETYSEPREKNLSGGRQEKKLKPYKFEYFIIWNEPLRVHHGEKL